MNIRRHIVLGLFAVAAVTSGFGHAADFNGPNQWLTDYGKARQLSRELGLPVIAHFHASWCGPCQQMEQETLSSQQLKEHLGTSFIGVKIDSDREPGLVEAFRVESLPSDVVIAPGGRIVASTAGYQTRARYLSTVQKWRKELDGDRQQALALLRGQNPIAQPANPQPLVGIGSQQLLGQPGTQQRVIPEVTQPAIPVRRPGQIVGLDGFSPVEIKTNRRWLKGDSQFAATHDGIVYHFTKEAELRTFLAAPHQFAPRMLGCDPVELWNTDRAVAGSVEYGAFFDNELFLFISAATRSEFKRDPARYVRLRHVLRADDILGATRFQ